MSDPALLAPRIQVYTGAGQLLETLPWDASSRIVALGFSWRDELAVVQEDGTLRVYALLAPAPASAPPGAPPRVEATRSSHYYAVSLGGEAGDAGVASASILASHVVAATHTGCFVRWRFPGARDDGHTGSPWDERAEAPAAAECSARLPAAPGAAARAVAWTAVPPAAAADGTLTVLVSTETALYALHEDGFEDLHLGGAPFSIVRMSPNGSLLALVDAAGRLRVVSADLSRELRTAELPEHGELHAAWCGDNCIALAAAGRLLLYGPVPEPLALPLRGAPVLVAEAAGLRVLQADAHEYVDKAPDAAEALFRPGSTHPAAILLDASTQAQRSQPRAYDAVRAIAPRLTQALDTCIAAAADAWDAEVQRELLRAALFGKAFHDTYDAGALLSTARTLRVLNAVRLATVGIPARFETVRRAGPDMLLYRLAARNMHLCAVRMCRFLGVRHERVLRHWAQAKIARSARGAEAEERLARAILARFSEAGALHYAEIAWTAWQARRPRLATLLLGHEVRAVDQVPLLLQMHEHDLALAKAAACGDPDLVYHVLFRLQRTLSRGEFFRHVQPLEYGAERGGEPDETPELGARAVGLRPSAHGTYAQLAARLLEVYAREQDEPLLRDFYFSDDRRAESAVLSLRAAGREAELHARIDRLREAARLFNEDAHRALEARAVEDECSLLGFQALLEKEQWPPRAVATGDAASASLVGLSLAETIRVCVQRRLHKHAERLRHEYKVPERRMHYIRLKAYLEAGELEELWRLATARKSPIGYAPYVRELVQAGYVDEARRYVAKALGDRVDQERVAATVQRCPAGVREKLERA